MSGDAKGQVSAATAAVAAAAAAVAAAPQVNANANKALNSDGPGSGGGEVVKVNAKTYAFTSRREVVLEKHLWFTDLHGRSRATAGGGSGVATPSAAAAQLSAAAPAGSGGAGRDVEDICMTLREYASAKATDGAAALLDATPRSGLSAAMAAAHLVAKLRLPIVADFVSAELPVSVTITRGEIANSVRIHGDKRLCVLVCDVKFAASTTGDALIRLLAAHALDFCTRHHITQLITIDGKPKQSAAAGRSAGSTGGGGGSGGGGDDGDDDDGEGEGNVEVDLDALGDEDGDDGDGGGGDTTDRSSALRGAARVRVRVQPTGAGGSGSGKAGGGGKSPLKADHKSDTKTTTKATHSTASAKGEREGAKSGDLKAEAKAADRGSASDSDSEESDSSESESDSDSDADAATVAVTAGGKINAKATDKKTDRKSGDKTKSETEKDKDKNKEKVKEGKEKERKDRILFVTNDQALAVRLRSAEFKPAPVTDSTKSAYTPKPTTVTAITAATAAEQRTAGMSVRVRAWKDGAVRGLTGAVLECAPVTALRVVGLFAAGGTKSLTDVKLSVELVKAVVALCGLTIGSSASGGIRVKALAKAARRIERKVKSAVKELTDRHTKSKRVVQSMYG